MVLIIKTKKHETTMNRRINPDRRINKESVLSQYNDRRTQSDRRNSGLDVREININKDVFNAIFNKYLSSKKYK